MQSHPVTREYDRLARQYETRWDRYIRASIDRTIRYLGLASDERLLDVGCGTGALLRALHAKTPQGKLAGIDLSKEMLTVARSGLSGSVELLRGDVHSMPFETASFGMVVSSSSFHYWDEPENALREIGRVLRPDGRVVITDWCDDFWACRLCDRALRIVNRAHRRIYGSQECGELLERHGYRIETVDRYKIGWLWGLMTVTAISGSASAAQV